MSRLFSFLLFIAMFFCVTGTAQVKLLQGKITNSRDAEGVHILNTTSRFNAITNENGNFSINVNKQDTLVFSSVAFVPEKLIVSEEIYNRGTVTVKLSALVNVLDAVTLGPNLSGNIVTDVQSIKTEKHLNFSDVGIPGFKGEGEEKIVPVAIAFFPIKVNLEAVYKYASGYYRKLKIKREWEAQNTVVASIINRYSIGFFGEAYSIPENRVYDFILFCIETSGLQSDFIEERNAKVLKIFQEKGEEFVKRLPIIPK